MCLPRTIRRHPVFLSKNLGGTVQGRNVLAYSIPKKKNFTSAVSHKAGLCKSQEGTLRECHIAFLLCTLPDCVRAVLLDWLIDPTDLYRWPPPSDFLFRRFPLAESDLRNKTRRVSLRAASSAFGDSPDTGLSAAGAQRHHSLWLISGAWRSAAPDCLGDVAEDCQGEVNLCLKARGFYSAVALWATSWPRNKMVMAALWSRSSSVPHSQECQRSSRSFGTSCTTPAA